MTSIFAIPREVSRNKNSDYTNKKYNCQLFDSTFYIANNLVNMSTKCNLLKFVAAVIKHALHIK